MTIISTNERPHINKTAIQLGELAETAGIDELNCLLAELKFRDSRKAKQIRQQVMNKLQGLATKNTKVTAPRSNYTIFRAKTLPKKYIEDNPEQELFINCSFYNSIIVKAPPGCGKTHALIGRLERHVLSLQNYSDARQILVLSFTRNAVNEIRTRLKHAIEDGAPYTLNFINVRTFDSFAWSLLQDDPRNYVQDDYEESIRKLKALMMIGDLRTLTGKRDRFKWIYIDEYQDLVGCRAELVIELIKEVIKRKGIMTLMGDPEQGIMNFQLKKYSSMTNSDFITKVKDFLPEQPAELEFIKNYRFDSAGHKKLINEIKQILNRDMNPKERYDQLLKALPPVDKEIGEYGSETETSAILCHTNADAALMYEQLQEKGYDVTLTRGAGNTPFPAWIWAVFGPWKQTTMSLTTFRKKLYQYRNMLTNPPEDISQPLQVLGVIRNCRLSVEELCNVIISDRSWPEETRTDTRFTVSTIHKAKGLQYDHVFYQSRSRCVTLDDECLRATYVAATRAKKSLWLLPNTPVRTKKTGNHYRVGNQILLQGNKEIQKDETLRVLETTAEPQRIINALFSAARGSPYLFSIRNNADTKQMYLCIEINDRPEPVTRMKALERFSCRNPTIITLGLPHTFITQIYRGDDEKIISHLGPTCMVPLPVFSGLYPFIRTEK
ncbi:UvrD-helicase domain-containing protein [Photobacterium nomapromontoriensis]|uniref:UvrD-helicase domain-containing protein n=1 Tax=Photobacterium nomapromontoriensis TaxID=2910237 RepID=UPI003D12BA14